MKKLVEGGSADAWDTVIDFLDYKSFLNVDLSIQVNSTVGKGTYRTLYIHTRPTGTPEPKFSVAGAVSKENAAHFRKIGRPDPNESEAVGNDWIIVDGGALSIDDMDMKKVILRNVSIYYAGAPLQMEDVYFMNCTFSVKQQSNGERLALAVLRPSPATTLDNYSESATLRPPATHY